MTHFLSRKAIIAASAAVLLAGLTPEASAQANESGAAPAAATDAPDAPPCDFLDSWQKLAPECWTDLRDEPVVHDEDWVPYEPENDYGFGYCHAFRPECGYPDGEPAWDSSDYESGHQAYIDAIRE
ncbi:hypothetical protein [Hyphomonas johnsonii]|uniref:Secreted protein n=1 Tax=Hyphomonas johnsonii MHS-2 TaxID=1280950 RepID=A0A059FQ07_9PROT|nr:hypothetical protein [Hyphomonas johnsonii]KCZ92707.1 hypothetical protein HJO_07127 [Hyphomonas johnsonii MHS-2]